MTTRYDISLDTGTSSDKNATENYFDQVIAMSQGIVNASFKDQFDSVGQKAEMFYNGPRGILDAILDAPSIMINGGSEDTSEIFYVLRIKSGKIIFNDNQSRDIHDWALAVRTRLSDIRLDILKDDSDRVRRKKARWLQGIAAKYPGFQPGDYGVQRIFCALGSAPWQDYHETLSTVWDPETKNRIKLSSWLDRSANQLYRQDILSVISGWAQDQDEKDTSTMGIKFNLELKDIKSDVPTFRPVYVYNQVYSYFKPGLENEEGFTDYGDYAPEYRDSQNPCGKLKDGDYNCLLYCENVDRLMGKGQGGKVLARPLPVNKKLGWNGNLAEPGIPPILGSFVMDHRVFMTTFLLPQMQELCQASYMQVGKPRQYYDMSDRSKSIVPYYAIGCELQGNKAIPADDAFFKLERMNKNNSPDAIEMEFDPPNPNDPADQTHYRWRKLSEKDGRPLDMVYPYALDGARDQPVGYGNYWIRAYSRVDVKWTAGSPKLDVSGKIIYDYQIAFADDREMKNPRELKYITTGTWTFSVVMRNVEVVVKDKDGNFAGYTKVLRPCIEGLENGRPKDTSVTMRDVTKAQTITDHTRSAIEAALNSALERGIKVIIQNVSNRFEHTGKLTYPGHGELEFNDPKFTRLGNLIATATYKKPSLQGNKMFFPKVDRTKMTVVRPSLPRPETSTFNASLIHNREPALQWYTDLVYNEKTRVGRLILRGTNLKPNPDGSSSAEDLLLAFSMIRISLIHTPNKDPATGETKMPKLFSEAPFESESHPGLMREFFDAGKALITEIIKVFRPAPDRHAEAVKRMQAKKTLGAGPNEIEEEVQSKTKTTQLSDTPSDEPSGLSPRETPKGLPEVATPGSGAAPSTEESPKDVEEDTPEHSLKPSTGPTPSATDTTPVTNGTAGSDGQGVSPPKAPLEPAKPQAATSGKGPQKPKAPRMIEVEEKVEKWKSASNVYTFKTWDQDEYLEDNIFDASTRVKLDIGIDRMIRSIDITLRPTFGEKRDAQEAAPKAFLVPHNKNFELQLQGEIAALGQYAIKIQEEWCTIEDGEISRGASAIDYKMVDLKLADLKEGGTKVVVDAYDVSDRLAQAKAKREAAAKA